MKSGNAGALVYWSLLILFIGFSAFAACPPGDLDGDCATGLTDLILFAEQWLDPAGCVGYEDNCADLVGNNGVDQADFAIIAEQWGVDAGIPVVINEIHYHTDNNTEPVEFIELYNAGTESVDLNGWYFEGAIGYTFASTLTMNPGDYVVVCQDPTAFATKFAVTGYGPFEGKLSNDGEKIVLRDAGGNKVDEVDYDSDFPWPVAANGEGASMELINPAMDNDLAGNWRSSGFNVNTRPEQSFGAPTPGAVNSVYADNAPPQIRQVNHEPEQPAAGESVLITAKITDPNSVKRVYLKYQVVSPGSYIPAYLPVEHNSLMSNPYQSMPLNPAFETGWTTVLMRDTGTYGDAVANDGIYTASITGQLNRTLMRYRIQAWDNSTESLGVQTPYADDPSLNFAYYVYDGVPDYVVDGDTSVHPDAVAGSDYTYSAETLTSIPVYTLITRDDDLYECNGYDSADQIDQGTTNPVVQDAGRAYNWEGAFVYDGKVYDHVGYRLRGGNGRYNNGAAGKRSMKFRFNRGNYFQARDIHGDKFPSKWQHLNTGKMFGNKIVWENYRHYPYALNEVMDMMLFGIADVPAAKTWWMHFRTVTGVDEAPPSSNGQYAGDFRGLHVAFENYDGAFLERLGLPKGNLYKLSDKIYDGARQLRYQGSEAVDDASDYDYVSSNLNHTMTAENIRNFLDCDEWYRYHTVTEAIRHYDIFSGDSCIHCMKNSAWYFYPDYTADNNYYGKLQFLPFDVDDTWGPYFNQGCDHAKAAIYDQQYLGGLEQFTVDPEKSPLRQEYRNYIREYRDLMWQPEVIDPMIMELASVIADIVPADRDRWKTDPLLGSPIDNGTLEEGVTLMQQFAWTAGGFPPDNRYYWVGTSNNLDNLANAENDSSNIPYTPTISYIGTAGYPENDLQFQTSAFSDPQGSGTFAAMKWRIAEVEPSSGTSGGGTITLLEKNQTWKYFKGTQEPPSDWTQLSFSDSSWLSGQTSIGYDDGDDNTILSDMQDNYTTLYLRKTFTVADVADIETLNLHVYIDDGCIVYVNGTEVARLYCSGGTKNYDDVTETTHHEASVYDTVSLTDFNSYLVDGTNVVAVHLLQELITSSDASVDVSITADLVESEEPVPAPTMSKKKYELQALWESDELMTFASDIRIPADGVSTGKTYRVRCKMKDTTGRWSHWSAPIEFIAGESLGTDLRDHLRITEVMYNNGDAEFIELQNTGTTTLDLDAVSFTSGVAFAFDGSAIESLAPGAFVLIVKDQDEFEEQYGTGYNSLIAGEFASGSLSNSGETIKMEDLWDGTIVEFEYNDGRGWPIAADGAGHSLVPLAAAIDPSQPHSALNFGGNWRQSTTIGGSPGAADPTPPAGPVINEFMAHTDLSDPTNYPDYDSNDWIELFNTSGSAVSLGGDWYLSDDMDELDKWALPSSSLASGAMVVYDEITGFHSPISSGFGLDKAGEQIFLSYLPGTVGVDRVVDCIQFKGQANSVSLGRYPDGGDYWFSMDPGTRNAANDNAVSHVVISEFMYHPEDDKDEYVELYNPTGSAVTLTTTLPLGGDRGWAMDGGVEYEFPSGTPALAAGAKILIVGFDPTDTTLLDAFEVAYGTGNLTAGTDIFGPWTGDLSNGGERLTLEKPQDSDDPLDPLTVSWIIVDECIYTDSWPWPTEADGNGLSLHRSSTAAGASGSNPANWQSQVPSPGS